MNRYVSALVLFSCFSCSTVTEQDFFTFPLTEIEKSGSLTELPVDEICKTGQNLSGCIISYPYLITKSSGEYLFSISDLSSGELYGQYCRRGRAANEPLSSLPLTKIYEKDDFLYADLFSYPDNKVLKWDITASLESRKDVYGSVRMLNHEKFKSIPLISIHMLSDSTLLSYNSAQNSRTNQLEDSPCYETYSIMSGDLKGKYELFNRIHRETHDDLYTSKNFLALSDCLKPDKTKLVFAMWYMPVLNILDLQSGHVHGVLLNDCQHFTYKKRVAHFIDVQADDSFIYALYFGKERVDKSMYPELLYVFDWDGRLIREFHLSHPASALCLDDNFLYMYNLDSDLLMGVDVCIIRSMLDRI